MISRGQLTALSLTALFAGLSIGVGMDRISEHRAALAPEVPPAFRVNAARSDAQAALAANRPEIALAAARTAIDRDPSDAAGLAALGQARLLLDQPASARAVFRVTDRMGWREPTTQIYWMLDALQRDDYRAASRRLDVVMRTAPRFDQRNVLLAQLESRPAGREQLAQVLARSPDWRKPYFTDLAALSDATLYLRGEVARRLATYQRAGRDCADVSSLVWNAAQRLGNAEAYDIWRDYCRGGSAPPGINDGDFEHVSLQNAGTPFDWRFSDIGEIDIVTTDSADGRGKTLDVASTAPGRRSFAAQMLRLAPGRYRLSWHAANSDGRPSGDITVSLQCAASVHHPLTAQLTDPARAIHAATADVPAGCDTQWIDLAIAGRGGPVMLDDFAIERAN